MLLGKSQSMLCKHPENIWKCFPLPFCAPFFLRQPPGIKKSSAPQCKALSYLALSAPTVHSILPPPRPFESPARLGESNAPCATRFPRASPTILPPLRPFESPAYLEELNALCATHFPRASPATLPPLHPFESPARSGESNAPCARQRKRPGIRSRSWG